MRIFQLKLPLKHILKSVPFWALVVANVGTIWAFMTVITYGPTYLKVVHGLGIREVRYYVTQKLFHVHHILLQIIIFFINFIITNKVEMFVRGRDQI